MLYQAPKLPTTSIEDLARVLEIELEILSGAAMENETERVLFVPQHEAPGKPEEGLVVAADGTDWDPGAGVGLYIYRSSAWVKLG